MCTAPFGSKIGRNIYYTVYITLSSSKSAVYATFCLDFPGFSGTGSGARSPSKTASVEKDAIDEVQLLCNLVEVPAAAREMDKKVDTTSDVVTVPLHTLAVPL